MASLNLPVFLFVGFPEENGQRIEIVGLPLRSISVAMSDDQINSCACWNEGNLIMNRLRGELANEVGETRGKFVRICLHSLLNQTGGIFKWAIIPQCPFLATKNFSGNLNIALSLLESLRQPFQYSRNGR